ncbi:alpha/beta fold hydrolase [Alteromonas sp. H39]|uniref:alpha/beta fold hydrolase n=1 Tax=Alteromonas sp. H39 TaxID=3389876 RepID=UPI0039DFF9A0
MTLLLVIIAVALAVVFLAWMYTRRVDAAINKQFPPSGKSLDVDGGSIHWQESGQGEPVVLIHGLSGNLHNFSAMESMLAERYTVYSVDRPGSGHARRDVPESANFEKQASMLLEWMTKTGLDRALIVGHSMGGAIALKMALIEPKRCAGLVLLCPLTAPLSEAAGPLKNLYIPNPATRRFLSATFATPVRMRKARENLSAIFAPDAAPRDFATRFGGALSMRSDTFFGAANDIVAAQKSLYKQFRQYGDISCPVGILFGGKDAVLAPSLHMKHIEDTIKDVTSVLLPERGHMVPISDPAACSELVDTIYTKVKDTSGAPVSSTAEK